VAYFSGPLCTAARCLSCSPALLSMTTHAADALIRVHFLYQPTPSHSDRRFIAELHPLAHNTRRNSSQPTLSTGYYVLVGQLKPHTCWWYHDRHSLPPENWFRY